MSGYAFFIDTSLCTGCRACQVACKQWNRLPASETKNRGSYQNPPDLTAATFKLLRFSEHRRADGKPRWLFFPDQCRHCIEPSCKAAADIDAPGGVTVDPATGAVLFTRKLMGAKARGIIDACPFNIPRVDGKSGSMAKCTMCIDRVSTGVAPACVKTCPTAAARYGKRDAMIRLAKGRLAQVRSAFPHAIVTGLDDLRCFFLLTDRPDRYYRYAGVDVHYPGMDRKGVLRLMGRSAGSLALGGGLRRRVIG